MGETMFAAWLGYKREEWRSYASHVTDWEKTHYLKSF